MPPARTASAADPTRQQVRAGVRGTSIAFIGSGFAFASWASRIPQVRSHLHLSPAQLGLMLLSIAVGSLLALPLSGPVVHRLGSRRTVLWMAALLTVAVTAVALGYLAGTAYVVAGLFVLGFAYGAWDVAMNVQGALVERHLGRSIMSRFHAGFSVGTVAGALVGAGMIALSVPVTAHLIAVAVGVGSVVMLGTRGFVDDDAGVEDEAPAERRSALAAWREPRTLVVGVVVLAFAFAEGTAGDWISIATIDGYDVPAEVGTLAFATFLSAMTVGRWFGPGLLDRYGRVPVLRVLCALGIGGTLLFVFAPVTPLAFIGALMWGLGTSLGFPVGMSAGADEPRYAAGRVSVIASIGYCAFLAGPPSVGFLGEHVTVLRSMLAVAVLLGVAALLTGAVRPPDEGRPGSRAAAARAPLVPDSRA
jgi:MFS family permease